MSSGQPSSSNDVWPPQGIQERRERVFLILAGLFLGTLTMLNILGITRFIDLSFEIFGLQIPFVLAVGVLPYPVTFLCTDFISEFYGEKRANALVWTGLLLNIWVVFILWLGGALPPQPVMDPATGLPPIGTHGRVFFEMKGLAFGAIAASMIAYLAAQFCDVRLFHFWKKLTGGKHLWLRNNASTVVSQLVDTTAVILITHFYANALPIDSQASLWPQLLTFIGSGYVFKVSCAALDTVPFYIGSKWLSEYLEIDPSEVGH
ncbi:MAG: queuosine precursor transporter [Deltaproteobacteria bacterium]|jgi:queuosine precursor transporter|nr:queuosine precursor transporter [Deltaproteobacteria bacterium]MBT6433498.1 queuosine precursor transporter [Deltaproteobacteria bacterium]